MAMSTDRSQRVRRPSAVHSLPRARAYHVGRATSIDKAMTDLIQIIGIIVIYTMLLAALPIFLLHLVRSLADGRRRLNELQARVDLLEARVGQYGRVADAT